MFSLLRIRLFSVFGRRFKSINEENDPLNLIGNQMKEIEMKYRVHLIKELPFIVRLDGCRFKRYTEYFKKPFDKRIYNAMFNTTIDLFKRFNPVLAYTFSDEISLLFVPIYSTIENKLSPIIYDGNVLKISSIFASSCSVRFNYHILKQNYDNLLEEKLIQSIQKNEALFDARAFSLTLEDCITNLRWRFNDCRRNSKNSFARHYYSAKQLNSISSEKAISNVKNEFGMDWNDLEAQFRFGTIIKRREVIINENQPNQIIRNRLVSTTSAGDLLRSNDQQLMEFLSTKFTNSFKEYDKLFIECEN